MEEQKEEENTKGKYKSLGRVQGAYIYIIRKVQ